MSISNKMIYTINQVEDAPSYFSDYVRDEINKLIAECKTEAKQKVGNPVKQHLTPKFILEGFQGIVGRNANRIRVLKYEFTVDGKLMKPRFMDDRTPKGFARRDDFYSIEEFYEEYEIARDYGQNDKFRIEKLLSVIETRAAPLIKFRQSTSVSSATRANPYFYEENESFRKQDGSIKNYFINQEKQRMTLAIFFAAQYLRSNYMFSNFTSAMNNNRLPTYEDEYVGKFKGKSFGDFIEHVLPIAAFTFYFRAWRWVYSTHDICIPAGTSLVSFADKEAKHPFAERTFCMPLGRNLVIYFSPQNTFRRGHDGVVGSKSLALNIGTLSNLVFAASVDLASPYTPSNERYIELAMSPSADLSYVLATDKEADPRLVKLISEMVIQKKNYKKDVNFWTTIPRC